MLYLLIPITVVLAFQDWRWRRVNLWLSLLNLAVLAVGVKNIYLAIAMFTLLYGYLLFRPGRIQIIDIATFSLGAGYFTLPIFSFYCLITSIALLVISILKKEQLPFLVAWAIGFWFTLVLQVGIFNHFLPSNFINHFNL